MTVEIKVPAMGESVTEATISKWFKKEGDAVKREEPLLEAGELGGDGRSRRLELLDQLRLFRVQPHRHHHLDADLELAAAVAAQTRDADRLFLRSLPAPSP